MAGRNIVRSRRKSEDVYCLQSHRISNAIIVNTKILHNAAKTRTDRTVAVSLLSTTRNAVTRTVHCKR